MSEDAYHAAMLRYLRDIVKSLDEISKSLKTLNFEQMSLFKEEESK